MNARLILAGFVLAALSLGCATTDAAPPEPHRYGVNNASPGIETQTWDTQTADSGKQLVFGRAHGFVTCLESGGTVWIRRRSPEETCNGTAPTSPVPSANGVASGWGRVPDGQPVTWGVEGQASTANEQTLCVDAWNQASAGASLVCIGH